MVESIGHVILNEHERSLQIRTVELVWNTEAQRSELSALIKDRVHETDSEDNVSPLLIWLNLLQEVLVDQSVVSTLHTCGNTLRRLCRHLNGHLQKTEREGRDRLTSNEETELLVHFLALGVANIFNFAHEFNRQVTIVEDNPETVAHSIVDMLLGNDFLFLTHRDLCSCNSLLSSQLVNHSSWVRTWGQ